MQPASQPESGSVVTDEMKQTGKYYNTPIIIDLFCWITKKS